MENICKKHKSQFWKITSKKNILGGIKGKVHIVEENTSEYKNIAIDTKQNNILWEEIIVTKFKDSVLWHNYKQPNIWTNRVLRKWAEGWRADRKIFEEIMVQNFSKHDLKISMNSKYKTHEEN